MIKLRTVLAVLFMALFIGGCTDARTAKWGGLGDQHKIELLNCDGTIAREWISTGKVVSEANSDGYYFMDQATGRLVEVNGSLVITKQ
jgi:hypothetical protein